MPPPSSPPGPAGAPPSRGRALAPPPDHPDEADEHERQADEAPVTGVEVAEVAPRLGQLPEALRAEHLVVHVVHVRYLADAGIDELVEVRLDDVVAQLRQDGVGIERVDLRPDEVLVR